MDDVNNVWSMWSNMICGLYFLVMPLMLRVMVNDCWRSCLQSVYDVFTMWSCSPSVVGSRTICPEWVVWKTCAFLPYQWLICGLLLLVMPLMHRVMVNDCGRVYKAFMMCLLCGRRCTPGCVYQACTIAQFAWTLELFALSEWFEKARQAAQRWMRFNLINPAPEESGKKASHKI